MTRFRGLIAVAGAGLIAALLVAGLALGGVFANDDAAAQESDDDRRAVNVSGDGEVMVQPDTGMVSLGVEVSAETADEALSESNTRIEAITAAIQELGVAEDDITTGNFGIWPEYDYDEGRTAEVIGFRVTHTVNVRVQDIEMTGDVVAEGVNAGANTVQNVSFVLENRQEAVNQARERAYENARQKAEALAGLAGSELGEVVSITEDTFEPGPVEREVPEEAQDDAGRVPFNPGDATVRVHLEVSWELQ